MNAIRALVLGTVIVVLGAPCRAEPDRARIAWLGTGTEKGSADFVAAFKQGLQDNGLVEGRQYVFDARYADNHYERFPELVADLLQRKPSVIMVVTVSSVRAAQRATKTVPIVMISTTDPVASGLVKSLARPGGNTTGFGNMAEDLSGKYIQLFQELRPGATRLGVLVNPRNPSSRAVFEKIRQAAQQRGVTAQLHELVGADDLDKAFAAIARTRPEGLALIADNSYLDRRAEICGLAQRHRIPVLGFAPDFADAGCVIGFGTPRRRIFRRSAVYVRKLLDGANPAELPVQLPVLFELAVNKKAARALGLGIPETLLLQTDRVIE